MKTFCSLVVSGVLALPAFAAGTQAVQEATIEPDTTARLVLQSRLSSKLNEPGDTISATLEEAIYVDGRLVMRRGTEFHGRVVAVKPAGRGQKPAQLAIVFERANMPWGQEPISVMITAIDDWDANEKLEADDEGKVSGGRRGDRTVDNVIRGAQVGGAGATVLVLTGGRGGGRGLWGAGGAAVAGGMLAGLLLTKGGDIRLNPGTIFRVKFVKPITLPVLLDPSGAPPPVEGETEPGSRPPGAASHPPVAR